MSEKFIIPPRTTDGNEIRKFFLNVCQYINGMMETKNSLSRAYLGTDQTGIASGVATKVLLDTEMWDIGSNFASYKYVCPVTGYYSAKWGVYGQTTDGAITHGLSYLYKNGVLARYGSYFQAEAAGDSFISIGCDDVYCAAADYLELWGLGVTTGATTFKFRGTSPGCFMSVHLISRS